MKEMKLGFITILTLTILGCINDNVTTLADLNGIWVDLNTKTDTLIFAPNSEPKLMILERGEEFRDGFLLPKFGSGPYEFNVLENNKILLRWTLASNGNFNEYYFKQTGEKLTIEKFFDPSSSESLLTFKKID